MSLRSVPACDPADAPKVPTKEERDAADRVLEVRSGRRSSGLVDVVTLLAALGGGVGDLDDGPRPKQPRVPVPHEVQERKMAEAQAKRARRAARRRGAT